MARLADALQGTPAGHRLGRPARRADDRPRPAGARRRDDGAGRACRPGRARGRRCGRTTRARGSTTSTRRRCGARSAARPSTTWRRCEQIERELQRQGYLVNNEGKLELTPKAVRRLGDTALRQVFAKLAEGGYGDHDQHDVGQAGELTGSTRPWRFGDEQSIDTAATVRNALLRGGLPGRPAVRTAPAAMPPASGIGAAARGNGDAGRGPALGQRLRDRRNRAARVGRGVPAGRPVLLDGAARHLERGEADRPRAVLAGRTRFPQDSLQVIGFSNYARELRETDLAGLGWDMVQGTNLHHALVLAGRFLDRRPEHNPVVLVITDGEPTAHLRRDGSSWFDWPPSPETLELTMAEVDKMTRRRATLNIFMLADDERLTSFVDEVARRNGGRVLQGDAGQPGRVRGQRLPPVPPGAEQVAPRVDLPQRRGCHAVATGSPCRRDRYRHFANSGHFLALSRKSAILGSVLVVRFGT